MDLDHILLCDTKDWGLHDSTLKKLSEISNTLRKKQIIVSRVMLKSILSRLMGKEIFLYENAQTGKLMLQNNHVSSVLEIESQNRQTDCTANHEEIRYNLHSAVHWSISHTSNYIGVAISSVPIGFDMEILRKRRFVEIARHVFHDNESVQIEQSMDTDCAKVFFKIWTLREAVYKMTGWGPFERTIPVQIYLQNQGFFFYTDIIKNNLIYSITSECPFSCKVSIDWLELLA